MNNDEMRFDPQTGMPLQPTTKAPEIIPNNIDNTQADKTDVSQTTTKINNAELSVENNNLNQMNNFQNIPTVEQSKEEFINKTQTLNTENQKGKKEGINYGLVIGLFIIIFAAIYFLFPILLKYI